MCHLRAPLIANLVVCIDEEKLQSEEGLNPHKTLDVVTGNLVLFPASLMHYTIPFESGEGRITLAFDVVPAMQTAQDLYRHVTSAHNFCPLDIFIISYSNREIFRYWLKSPFMYGGWYYNN